MTAGAARSLGQPAKIGTPRGVIAVALGRGCVSCDALDQAPGTENGPAAAQIAGVFAINSAEIERYECRPPREDWPLVDSQKW